MRSPQVFFFILPMFFVLTLTYLTFRLKKWSAWGGRKSKLLMGAMVFFLAGIFGGFYLLRSPPEQFREWSWAYHGAFIILGTVISLLIYTIALDLLFLPKNILTKIKKKPHADNINLDRRKFIGIGAATAGSVAVGYWQGSGDPNINHQIIRLPNLPKEFVGFKIAQISDLHIGTMIGPDYIESVIRATNAIGADIIALTGDIADGSLSSIKNDVQLLKALKAKEGVLYITGNHEYFWGVEDWLQVFKENGARTLLNEHIVLTRETSKLVIAGVTDFESAKRHPTHVSDPKAALLGAPEGVPKILLAHQPKSYKAAQEAGFDLQLSGHTHGGQFFPWSIFVALAHPYYRGLNKFENMWIYTSTGTGFWGPPLRFSVPKEIALIELRSDSEDS